MKRGPLLLAAGIALPLVGGFPAFLATLPLADATTSRGLRCLSVFTGRPERIDAALGLLKNAKAARMLISGVEWGINGPQLRAMIAANPGLVSRIDYGMRAADTWGNAVETAHWARRLGCPSVVVVTDRLHGRRALWEMRRAAPDLPVSGHFIERVPTPGETRWRRAIEAAKEYGRYVVRLTQNWLGGLFGPHAA